MPYATIQQAIDLYGENYIIVSTDKDNDGEIDRVGFRKALDQATSELNSYVGVAYDLPLAVVPDVLRRFCVDVAVYISGPEASELTDEKISRYEKAIDWAKMVAEGKATLGTPDIPAGADEEGGTVLTSPSTSDRVFTRTKMAGLL